MIAWLRVSYYWATGNSKGNVKGATKMLQDEDYDSDTSDEDFVPEGEGMYT